MAYYADETVVKKTGKPDLEHWTATHKPGEKVPLSGIYKCNGCDHEIAANKGDPFPPQNHHQHNPKSSIIWRLIVRAETK